MTTANEIVAEALRKADIGYSPTHFRAQPGEDASISPSAQTAKAWEPAVITLSQEQLRARPSCGSAQVCLQVPITRGPCNRPNSGFTHMRPAAKQQSTGQFRRRDLTVAFPCGGFAALLVDPKLADDPDQDGVSTITLSYAFYLERGSAPSAAESPPPPAHGPARLPGRI